MEHHVGAHFRTQAAGSEIFYVHYAMSLRTTAPCLQTLKHLFCCSLLPGKLDRIVTLSPNYEKENWGPKRRAVYHRSHSWTGKDSDQQPIGIPMAVRKEFWVKWRAAWRYGRHLPQVFISEHDWAVLGAPGVCSPREGSAKGAATL